MLYEVITQVNTEAQAEVGHHPAARFELFPAEASVQMNQGVTVYCLKPYLQRRINFSVITSYSIHYTKLYE